MRTLSIIIPVYNEEKTVCEIIRRVKATNIGRVQKEIIVVDDGSTDKSRSLLKHVDGIVLIRHKRNEGKGAAIRTALSRATGTLFVIQDADLEYDPHDIPKLIQPILDGKKEVVFGSRFLIKQKPSKNKGYKMYYLGNKLLSLVITVLYGTRLTDIETGYKAFSRSALSSIHLRAKRFDFEPEITAKFIKAGFDISEVPITYTSRSFQEGKKITWKDGIQALFCLIKYRFAKNHSLKRVA